MRRLFPFFLISFFFVSFVCFCVRITSGGGVKGEQSLSRRISAGWRTRRSGREESVVEGDEGFASFTPSRRQFYSRTLSRDLPLKNDGEDAAKPGSRISWDAASSSGTLPGSSQPSESTLPAKFSQEPIDRVATLHGSFNENTPSAGASDNAGSRERPLSTVGSSSSPSGEAIGRVGGHYEQRDDNLVAPLASSTLNKEVQEKPKEKQSMQQLQDLVTELESVPDEVSELSEKLKGKTLLKLTPPGGKGYLATPKPSKSLTSFQKQQPLTNYSSSNPNILVSLTISPPNQQQQQQKIHNHSVASSGSPADSKTIIEQLASASSASSIKSMKNNFPTKNTILTDDEGTVKNQHITENSSGEKVSKNTFIPYNPNLNPNNASHKNLYVDKQINLTQDKSEITPIPSNRVKIEKTTNKLSIEPNETNLNNFEKRNGYVVGAEPPSENSKLAWNLGQSLSKLNDQNKKSSATDTKNYLTVEPYRKGRSEDLKATIDIVNASDSTKDGTVRGPAKVYRKSKSRDIKPAIEVASEKFTQLNSSTLRRISPFEAYKRSKSRELGSAIDIVNNSNGETRMKSPPPSSEILAKSDSNRSHFKKAKTSFEKKFERSKSPPLETETATKEVSKLSSDPTKDLKSNSNIIIDIPKPKEKEIQKEKTIKEPDKPKSMYKIITSKFSRSLSNVGEEKHDSKQATKDAEEENLEKEDKFKLKRPSRFLKTKLEKSSSRTSFSEVETKDDDDSDKCEKRSSKKLSNALNKFLGRKLDDTSNKLLPTKSTSAAIIVEKQKKPPRFKTKKFSKSQENLNQKPEDDLKEDKHEGRAKSVFPDTRKTDEVTLESAAKDICNHLSQIEINITSRIGNMSPSIITPPKKVNPVITTSPVPSINLYGLYPTLSGKKGSSNQFQTRKLSPISHPEYEQFTRKKSYGDCSEDGSITPTESGNESTHSGLEEIKETEDESVMDRITRKSYYSRFNETKRKPKPKRIDSRETMDQQLAAAKARLMQEEQANLITVRESMSPSRKSPQSSMMSTSPPPVWDGVTRRNSKTNLGPRTTSLPPEDGMVLYGGGIRSPTVHSPLPDESVRPMRHPSMDKEEPVFFNRAASVTRDDPVLYRRKSSVNMDDASNYRRLSSVMKDDPSFYLRQPPVVRDEQPAYRLPSSAVKDETPSYRRLSLTMRDEPQTFRRSPITKEESQNYRRLSSSHFEDNLNDRRLSSVPRDDLGYRRLSSATRDETPIYHTLQYKKSSSLNEDPSFNRYNSSYSRDALQWQPGRNERFNDSAAKSPPISPSIIHNQRHQESMNAAGTENYGRPGVWAAASAAGKAAGEAAAAVASSENSVDASQRISSPTSVKSPSDTAAVKSAREELTRRLTPLTRLSNMGSRESSSVRPYRRTVTTGNLPLGQSEISKTPTIERPTYKRTNTIMDLPPTDSRIRTTDYRRVLQDPARRFTGVRSTGDGSNPSMTSSFLGRSSFSSYSPTSSFPPSYSRQSINTILRRGSLNRY